MIILLLKLIFITSLLVLGYTIFSQEFMGGYWIRLWAMKKKEAGSKWIEPIFLCHYCQPSTWTLFSFLIAYGLGIINNFEWRYLLLYILCIAGSSITNGIVWAIHQGIIAKKDYDESGAILHNAQLENIYQPMDELDEDYDTYNNFFDYDKLSKS